MLTTNEHTKFQDFQIKNFLNLGLTVGLYNSNLKDVQYLTVGHQFRIESDIMYFTSDDYEKYNNMSMEQLMLEVFNIKSLNNFHDINSVKLLSIVYFLAKVTNIQSFGSFVERIEESDIMYFTDNDYERLFNDNVTLIDSKLTNDPKFVFKNKLFLDRISNAFKSISVLECYNTLFISMLSNMNSCLIFSYKDYETYAAQRQQFQEIFVDSRDMKHIVDWGNYLLIEDLVNNCAPYQHIEYDMFETTQNLIYNSEHREYKYQDERLEDRSLYIEFSREYSLKHKYRSVENICTVTFDSRLNEDITDILCTVYDEVTNPLFIISITNNKINEVMFDYDNEDEFDGKQITKNIDKFIKSKEFVSDYQGWLNYVNHSKIEFVEYSHDNDFINNLACL